MPQDNVDVIEAAWEAFANGDIDAATADTTDDAEISIPASLPWGGTYTGPEGFREFQRRRMTHFSELKGTAEKVLGADDDHVVVVARYSGRNKDGEHFEDHSLWLYRLRGGRIARAEQYTDTARLRELVG